MIYLDVSSAVHSKAGLSRYTANLANELRGLLGARLAIFQNSLGRRGPLAGWEDAAIAGVRWGYKPWRAQVLAGQLLRLPVDRLFPEAELFHATEHLLPYLAAIPTVLTVHDLVFERYPEYHKFWNYRYLKMGMPIFCRRATALIAVSEATKADLVAFYGLDPQSITVIPEAAAHRFRPQNVEEIAQVRGRLGLPERYVLSVGTLEPRKNLIKMLQACAPLIRDRLLDGIVLVGAKGWLYEEFFAYLEGLPWRERVIVTGFVPDEDLPSLYAGALTTIQPSLYEGFGLPVLEAMASGSPVCASRTSSLPEVGGEAALYFDPQDVEEMTSVLRRVVTDEALRAEMRQRGLERAAAFSWRATAERTAQLYERVLSGEGRSPRGASDSG